MARAKINQDKLTKAQEIFVNELVKGSSQRQAYVKAYPSKRKWKETSLDVSASALYKNSKIQVRYQELLKTVREKEQEKTMWTREQSIEALRFVIDTNRKDLERINAAHEEEIEMLLQKMLENPEESVKLVSALLQLKKSRRASQVNNKGITDAVAELNKMQGFNEETINMNGSVVFTGEDQLED